jgi:hypothetical protein
MNKQRRLKDKRFRGLGRNKEKFLLLAVLLVSLLFGIYLVFNVRRGIPPDENYHIYVSEFYSETLLIPENTEQTYRYGEITRVPYFSFWLNARLINLNFTNVEDYIILRFFNLIISLGSLIVVYLISKEVINKKYFNLLPVFLLSNTLMFVFLSSAVSYDNLSNLFVFLTVYFFVKYLKYKKPSSLLYLIIFQVLAILTKFTVAPVIFIEFVFLTLFVVKHKNLRDILKNIFSKHKPLLVVTFFVLSLGFLLYGVNLIKYRSVRVPCDKVLTVEQCMHNAIYARGKTLDKYSFTNISELKDILKARITPFEYFTDWVMAMTQRVFGILGHKVVLMHKYFANVYIFLFFVLSFIAVRKWKKKDMIETNLIVITTFYILVLLVFQNYKTYFKRDMFGLALQGRYLFPILPIVYIILIRYLRDLKSRTLRFSIAFLLIVLFLLGCIPFFFRYIPDSWFL